MKIVRQRIVVEVTTNVVGESDMDSSKKAAELVQKHLPKGMDQMGMSSSIQEIKTIDVREE